ncbi:acetoacetate--CoA ligase [Lipingzhangella sp. LS1_29]|uniref:Acetoacetate--CoA ligase n=1 Tax=Lipingzhangella rawalii TaxID=2055835 RepID=A0ABU2H7N4_9ACTN|nr:acetoacetate--CoA ligase [Lipingzhangella rawalii]MDS1270992.1 acetoacetate--CoA ligase [Lipingzhangella rawalii]
MPQGPQPRVLWQPDADRVEQANITAFARWVRKHYGVHVEDYHALWRWSTTELADFWAAIWQYFDVHSDTSYERVFDEERMPGTNWFPGARLNYAQHIFRARGDSGDADADTDTDTVAIRHASELRATGTWTWAQLRERTAAIAEGLRKLGVQPGDRVVAYMPNIPETVAAFYACAAVGAVWSSCSPDFGVRSVVDRFAQIEPTVLLTVDGYRYGGKDFDRRSELAEIRAQLPTLRHTVLLPYLDAGPVEGAMSWQDLEDSGRGADLRFEPVPFDHPLWVLYSSGTTGLPKAIIHGHGGILLEQLKSLYLHVDCHDTDRVFWYTTTGWMMWNFLVSVLLTDASIVLYDGSPQHPDLGVLWDLAAETGVTVFGTSASYLSACMKDGVEPATDRDLSGLHAIGSTGSPLTPEGFTWVYEQFGDELWLFSTSGGTDICSSLVGGVPTLPVFEGEIQARLLGYAVAAWDPDGRELVGEVGELVVTRPAPSMPLGLWNDPDGRRYHESYFSMYPGVWRHGDWIEITERGTAVIYGRSDSTINRGGIRMGTSEFYRAVLALDEVTDALVVDVPYQDTGRINLFVVLRAGTELDEELRRRLARAIREDCSPRHVPDEVHAIQEVPRTLSGKILEVPVKRILMGEQPEQVASRDSLANPSALDYFARMADRD